MGFGPKWRKWMRMCISFASIAVLVNGSMSNWFKIRHGLRQGCPLSPLLFNLVGETLSSLLRKAKEVSLLKGVSVVVSGLKLNLWKCNLYGINVEEGRLSRWVVFLKCGHDRFLTKYLGLPLVTKSSRVSEFEYSIDGDPIWKLIWANLAPPKVEAFVWRVMQHIVPVLVELLKRAGSCGTAEEGDV
ncbi:hypothetical protein F3Y22_tig00116973pilonHSYRG00090 [Hibiscus syriacus]|uniref:Uncharacterized protein n=1 Tax=Hibiscus syriacus TaxID=106335 RepID=A0A6A2WIT5_HIBSY|nr:hypothetical protein F3Y22_tig00116973pilonHSYRG00090 [Hibiscus syriacus]